MSVFVFSPSIYRPHFTLSPISNSSYHGRRVTAQFKETEEAPIPNTKQEEEIKPLQTPTPSKSLSPTIEKDIKKVVQKAAGTFAPRASTAQRNPAVPGSALYTVFEVQGYLSMVFGGALAFNLIFPSSEPDIWRLMGMWSIWMFTIPSLRARDCSKEEKEALNYLFLLIPLINVILPFYWRSFSVVWSADTLTFFVMYAWKLKWLQKLE